MVTDTSKRLRELEKRRKELGGLTEELITPTGDGRRTLTSEELGVDIPQGWSVNVRPPAIEGRDPRMRLVSPEGQEFQTHEVLVTAAGEWITRGEVTRAGFERRREVLDREQLSESIGRIHPQLFPELRGEVTPDISAIEDWINRNPEEFAERLFNAGRTPETEDVLRAFGASEEEIDELLPLEPFGLRAEIPITPQAVLEPEPEWQSVRTQEVITQSEKDRRFPLGHEAELDEWRLTTETARNYFTAFKVFGEALTKLPKQMGASILQAVQGHQGASAVDKGWADRFIEDANTDLEEFVREVTEEHTGTRLPIKLSDLAALPQSMSFSLTSMGAGLGVGIPTAFAPVPGARVAAWVAGTAASGAVAFNMASYQIMQTYLDVKNEEMKATVGRELTLAEEEQLKRDFSTQAIKFGLWEAVPEALSNLAFARLLTLPLGRMVGRSVATKITAKLAGIYGEEFLTETITQKGQSNIEVEAGLREGRITWLEAFKEIAPQTFLLTTILGGLGQVGISSVNRIKKSLKKETGDSSAFNAINENITEDIFAEVEAEAVTAPEAIAPEVKVEAPRMTRQEEELIKKDIVDLESKLRTAPVEEREAIQRRIDILKADLERGEALIGVIPEVRPTEAEEISLRVSEMEAEVAGLKEFLATESATRLVNLIKKAGWFKGEVSNLTLKQYRDITGKSTILPNILTKDKKHVRWEFALDDIATEMGYESGEALKTAIEQAGETQVKIRELEREIAVTEIPPAVVKPPPPTVAPAIEETPTTVIQEGGTPISPDTPISKGIVELSPVLQDVGVKERVRPTRKVFERMGLYEIHQGIREAEVLIGEARTAKLKEFKALRKLVPNKERWGLIVDEIEDPGSVKGLTFNEKRVVSFWEKWADEWADIKNLPKEKRIKNYFTHLFDQEARNQLDEFEKLPPELAALLDEKVAKKISDPFLKERLGAVGWLKDPFKAMEAYEAVANRVLYYEPMLQMIATIANNPLTHPTASRYLKDYSRRMTGEQSKFDQDANVTLAEFGRMLEKFPGGEKVSKYFTQGNAAGMASYHLTSALYTLWLGGKATSAIRNLSQHTLIIGEVGPVNFAKGIALRFTEEGKAALDHSLSWRSRRAAFVPGIDDSFVAGWTDKFREVALFMFRAADAQNVKDAYLSGFAEAKSLLPDANPQVWYDRGDEVAADTQYLYTKMNSMAVSQSSLGRVFSVLTTWTENWMELMTKWVSRRPSQVYLQYEEATGTKIPKKNWSQTYKAILIYMFIIALGYELKERTRLKAWDYTGITSLRYLGDIASGEFPGLQIPGAVIKMVTSFITDDERGMKGAWSEFRRSVVPSLINQIEHVANGDRDWQTLLFYLEGRDYPIQQLKEKWEKGWVDYEALETQKERDKYREDNFKVEAQMFISGRFTTLSTEDARQEVLRIIEKEKLNTELIKGYEKIFGVDTDKELATFRRQLGKVELDEEGNQKLKENGELDYFTTSNFASEVNKLVSVVGREKVEKDGNPLAKEYLRAKDLFVQYDSLTTDEARTMHRQQFPDVEASLYLWGRIASFKNPRSAELLLETMEKYNIPPESVPAFLDKPERYDELFTQKFELEKKTFELDILYENYGLLGSPLYIKEDDRRKEAREKLKEDNPEWVANNRRIEAIDAGASEPTIEKWVERGKVIDEFGAGSSEAKVWLMDNGAIWDWAVREELLTDDGTDWNFEVLRFNAKWRKEDTEYDEGIPDAWKHIVNPDERASKIAQAREDLLFNNPEYHKDRYRRDALSFSSGAPEFKEFPEDQIETFVEWNTDASLKKPDGWPENLEWYADEWWLQEHETFHDTMVDLGIWKEHRDLSKVPTREVFGLYQVYLGLPKGQARTDYRAQQPTLEVWLVEAKGYKPLEGRGDTKADLSGLEEIARKAQDIQRRLAELGK